MKIITSLALGVAAALLADVHAYSADFDLLDHTSMLNYYHVASTNLTAEQTALPDTCKVDQVHAVVRHMTRYPSTGSYNGLVRLATKFQTVLESQGEDAELASELDFLRTWNLSDLITDSTHQVENITALGLEEGFEFGKTMREKYADLYQSGATVWSGSVERVQLSAKSFMNGFFGESAAVKNLILSNSSNTNLGANTLTPIDTCTNYVKTALATTPQTEFQATWVSTALARLETLWPGFGFISDDLFSMMDLCMYEMNLLGENQKRFCKIFTDNEWELYAYNKDLGYYYGSGYGNPLAATVGFPYVQAVADLLAQKKTNSCQKIYVAFSHDTQLGVFAAAYGLNYDASLPSSYVDTNRRYRSSRTVTMGARMITERISCGTDRYVRVSINDAVVPFDDCQDGPGLSCALNDFLDRLAAKKEEVGDFIEVCGVTSNNATTLDLFQNPVSNLCSTCVEG